MSSFRLLRFSYWLGAVADFLAGVVMVYPPLTARLLSLDEAHSDSISVRAKHG